MAWLGRMVGGEIKSGKGGGCARGREEGGG